MCCHRRLSTSSSSQYWGGLIYESRQDIMFKAVRLSDLAPFPITISGTKVYSALVELQMRCLAIYWPPSGSGTPTLTLESLRPCPADFTAEAHALSCSSAEHLELEQLRANAPFSYFQASHVDLTRVLRRLDSMPKHSRHNRRTLQSSLTSSPGPPHLHPLPKPSQKR